MEKGRIARFDTDRNFGFITPEQGGEDLFFHKNQVRDAGYDLEPGAPVEFERGPSKKKPGKFEAVKVVLKGSAPDEPPSPPAQACARPAGNPNASGLPAECRFASFYAADGQLDQRVFYGPPEAAAACFRAAGLKPTQFRQLYQAFLAFAGPLRDRRMTFAAARERFGAFYCERVVRQVERKVLPAIVKELIDAHRDLALSDEREMLALFRYLTYIYCYFGDSEKN